MGPNKGVHNTRGAVRPTTGWPKAPMPADMIDFEGRRGVPLSRIKEQSNNLAFNLVLNV